MFRSSKLFIAALMVLIFATAAFAFCKVANKLFFFAAYQGTTLRQDAADNTAFVPTAAMRAQPRRST